LQSAEAARSTALRDTRRSGDIPIYSNPEWLDRFPWLVQGTTGRGDDAGDNDFSIFGATPSGVVVGRWLSLRQQLGFARAAHARQVHKADVLVHGEGPRGLLISERFDGHATSSPDLLLAVTIADCVPIFVVDEHTRAIALLHSGWRGTAARILEQGVHTLEKEFSASAKNLHVYCGPAICGKCYEVSPEVHRDLGLAVPAAPAPVDLRAVISDQARALGIPATSFSTSSLCTRCDNELFFSHRAGDPERQVAVLGVLA
jgi:polyphenol oxidase